MMYSCDRNHSWRVNIVCCWVQTWSWFIICLHCRSSSWAFWIKLITNWDWIWTLSLQVITWLVVRQVIFFENIDLLKFLSILNKDSVTFDKDSDFILNKDSDSRFLCLSENTSHNLTDETTDKFFKAQTQFQFVVNLIQNAQKLNLQCRQIINQLHVCTQQCVMSALQLWSLLQLYIIDAEDLLRYVNCVLISVQKALCSQLLKIYYDCFLNDH